MSDLLVLVLLLGALTVLSWVQGAVLVHVLLPRQSPARPQRPSPSPNTSSAPCGRMDRHEDAVPVEPTTAYRCRAPRACARGPPDSPVLKRSSRLW